MFGFTKGKIEITLQEYNYAPGQVIQGVLKLTMKKSLPGEEISVQLLGQETITSGDVDTNTSKVITLFDFTQPLEGPREYTKGDAIEYPFQITIPGDVLERQPDDDSMLATMGKMLSSKRSQVKWRVIGRAKLKGFDVTKKIDINIA
ncbi:hypothetical protein ACFL2D_00070 [Patescibacteria group bacterium]